MKLVTMDYGMTKVLNFDDGSSAIIDGIDYDVVDGKRVNIKEISLSCDEVLDLLGE